MLCYTLDLYTLTLAIAAMKTSVQLYLTPPVAVVGMVCNVLSIAVLSRDTTMASTTSLILKILATADFLNIALTTILTSLSDIQNATYLYIVKPVLFAVCLPLQSTAFTASVWLEVLLTFERYLAVCYPMHVGNMSTQPRVRRAIISVWIFAVLFNISRGFETLQISEVRDKNGTVTNVLFFSKGISEIRGYHIAYIIVAYPIVTLFLPIGLLVFFTTRILRQLNQSYKEKLAMMTSSDQEERAKAISSKQRRTTAILVSVVIIFLLSQVLTFVHFIYSVNASTFPVSRRQDIRLEIINKTDIGLTSLAYFSTIVKSTLNFFIFCLTGKKYRHLLKEAFHCEK